MRTEIIGLDEMEDTIERNKNGITLANLGLKDKSNDKKYYTEIPNIIYEKSSSDELALYGHIKRYAGANQGGVCFARLNTLAEKCKWGSDKHPDRRKVIRIIKSLTKKGWIRKVGKKKTKRYPINVYEVTDIWLENVIYFTKKKEANLKKMQVWANKEKINGKIDWDRVEEIGADNNSISTSDFWNNSELIKDAIMQYKIEKE